MKKALLKDSVKEIKNTYKRFISILLMAFLGVGFFAGLRATSPDMLDTIDKYYKQQNVYDIQILSTLGLTKADLEELAKIENVEEVTGSYETDGKIEIENKEIVTKFITIEEINQPVLLSGKMPENTNECLVEESFLTANGKQLGDTIQVNIEKTTTDEGEEIDYLKENELTIVGTLKSPLYISRDRGTSNLGAGTIDYYIYIPEENINASAIYTNIYIKVEGAEKYVTSSDKYEDYIEEVKDKIETIKEQREQARHDELVKIAEEKLQDAENEFNTKKEEGQQEIDQAQSEIDSAKTQIQEAEEQINANTQKAEQEFKQAETEIANAKKQIQTNEQTLATKEEEANTQIEELENQKQELQENLNQVNTGLGTIQEQYNLILAALANEQLPEEQKQIYEAQKQQVEAQISTLNQNKQDLENGITQIEQGITTAKQEIENAKQQINQAKTELSKQEQTLNTTKKTTYAQLEDAQNELEESKKELQEGEDKLNQSKQEFEEQIAEAQKELQDAKEEILKIENPTWYILDRNANAGYVSFIQDTESIENISKVFPAVFFIVAALISLTSMARMVEEQRVQIGTLKALGYNKFQIMSKYLIYAGLACVIGSILGMSVGFILLPNIIWMLYSMMYQIADAISISFNLKYGGMGLIFISICIIGATIYTALKELVNTPANLMRPKAPKNGNRVLLEKITFIWKRLNFSHKVTIRNIFRYKKRFFMTIIGILGCTALILTGFGIKDSVLRIMPTQFETIFEYDWQISLKESLEETQKEEFLTKLKEKPEIQNAIQVYMASVTAIKGENSEGVQLIVPKSQEELDGIINLRDINNKKQKVELKENEICLTDKLAELLNVQAGDTLILQDGDEKEIEIKISYIVENYVSHYIYMTKETYETFYDKDFQNNVILVKSIDLDEEQQDNLASDLMQMTEVSSVTNVEATAKSIEDTMSLLNYVVIVLIVAAGLLAFVVLYNLANVNISERIRELATIKVLGFYDREVFDYVMRETIILTAIGIALGLVGGYFLNYYILGTCEINMLRFDKTINWNSYVYATLLTILFSIIVNIATYFALKKIDMIQSLKSVE